MLILPLDFGLFYLSASNFYFLLFFFLLLLFHPAIQVLHWYFISFYQHFLMIHLTLSRGYVFMLRCTFELELSKTYLLHFHIHLNYYLFVVLSLSFCLAFFLLSRSLLWALGYVLFRVGVVTISVITGVSADHFNVIRLIQASHLSIRFKIPCRIYGNIKSNAQ